MSELFTLRDARETDKGLIDYYAYCEGMDTIPSIDNIRVAVNADDECVGFCRRNFDDEGVCYINPVVTNAAWRGFGVGRALVKETCDAYGEVRLVARGASIPFYVKLGFVETPWDTIAPGVTDDCDGCPMREECGPLPMRWKV